MKLTSTLAYGQQQLALSNTYYGGHCFMPLHIYEGVSGKLVATVLKPGRRGKSVNVFAILKRLAGYPHQYRPGTLIILRGDGHFCSKEFMDWSHTGQATGFITGLTGNKILDKLAKVTVESAQREFKQYGEPVKKVSFLPIQSRYVGKPPEGCGQSPGQQHGHQYSIRYITGNLKVVRAKALHELGYCPRGAASELRIKEHKTYLLSDRMSCNSFGANQFRLFLHSAAYVLIHALQTEMLQYNMFEVLRI